MGSIRPCLLITAALTASLIATTGAQSFGCTPAEWKTHNGILSCKTYSGKSNAIELADHRGKWTHAYQEVDVVPNAVYRISGEFYPLVPGGDCDNIDSLPKFRWCSPSVTVCFGAYNGEPDPAVPPEHQIPPFPAGSAGCDLRSVRCCTAHAPARLPLARVQPSTTPKALARARLRPAGQQTHGLRLSLHCSHRWSFASPCTSTKRAIPTPLW